MRYRHRPIESLHTNNNNFISASPSGVVGQVPLLDLVGGVEAEGGGFEEVHVDQGWVAMG